MIAGPDPRVDALGDRTAPFALADQSLEERQDELATLCMTKYKTYVCRKEFHDFYCRMIDEAPDLIAFDHVRTDFLGSKAIGLHDPMARRMVYEMMVRSGMRSLSERVYR